MPAWIGPAAAEILGARWQLLLCSGALRGPARGNWNASSWPKWLRRNETPELAKLTLPVRLALLVAGTMLPMIVFAVGIVVHDYVRDRGGATERVLETVRGIRFTLDAEIRRMTGGLQVLALTDALRNGDFKNFRGMAKGYLDQYGKDGLILVSDKTAQILFSSRAADDENLPFRNSRETVQKVFATKQPQYSGLFVGSVKKKPIIAVDVPVLGEGEVIYDIS